LHVKKVSASFCLKEVEELKHVKCAVMCSFVIGHFYIILEFHALCMLEDQYSVHLA